MIVIFKEYSNANIYDELGRERESGGGGGGGGETEIVGLR